MENSLFRVVWLTIIIFLFSLTVVNVSLASQPEDKDTVKAEVENLIEVETIATKIEGTENLQQFTVDFSDYLVYFSFSLFGLLIWGTYNYGISNYSMFLNAIKTLKLLDYLKIFTGICIAGMLTAVIIYLTELWFVIVMLSVSIFAGYLAYLFNAAVWKKINGFKLNNK